MKILIVTDDDDKLSKIQKAVRGTAGLEFVSVASVEEAENAIRNGSWQVIFWDYFLIDKRITIQLIEWAHILIPETKMVACSVDEDCRREQVRAGCQYELDPATHPTLFSKFLARLM